MAVCKFCGQEFNNRQAVRAHLKGCDAYHENETSLQPEEFDGPSEEFPQAMFKGVPKALPKGIKETGPVDRIRQDLDVERTGFDLERLREEKRKWKEHREQEEQKKRRREVEEREDKIRAERERAETVERTRLEAEEKQRRQAAITAMENARWGRIERVKRQAVDNHFSLESIPLELKVEAKTQIEKELLARKIDYLSDDELHSIGIAVRKKIYTPYFEKKRKEEAESEQRGREDQARLAEERWEKAEREKAEDAKMERKHKLLEIAKSRAKKILKDLLNDVEDLDPLTSYRLEEDIYHEVLKELEVEITGDEKWGDVKDDLEDTIEDLLDRELKMEGYM